MVYYGIVLYSIVYRYGISELVLRGTNDAFQQMMSIDEVINLVTSFVCFENQSLFLCYVNKNERRYYHLSPLTKGIF